MATSPWRTGRSKDGKDKAEPLQQPGEFGHANHLVDAICWMQPIRDKNAPDLHILIHFFAALSRFITVFEWADCNG